MLFRAAERLDAGRLGRALDALAAHHDALRARFRRAEGAWRAEIAAAEPPVHVTVEEVAPEGLATALAALQTSLDLAEGPVFRAAILRLPDADRLLWVVHHLVVDWVSWAALLPDLEAAYVALGRGEAPDLPPPTDAFADWARAVAEGAVAPEWAGDEDHWRRLAEEPAATVPLAEGEDRAGEAATLSVALDAATTAALLGPAARRHDAGMEDLLLAALAAAARPLAGPGRLRVMLEGHGRDSLLAPGEVSRTVGWFTSFHPVAVPLPEPGAAPPVAAARDARRAVPRNGLGYLLAATRPGGPRVPVRIGLNYLGRVDDAAGGALLRLAVEDAGPATHPAAPRALPLEFLAQVAEGRLRVALTFTPARADPAAMRALLDRMAAALGALAADGAGDAAPDTRLAGLDAGALDALLSDWD
jgi:non-ribosomal peptide synthase protein (TIGR01720 family)